MPKAILEFNLPEEDYEHEVAVNAGKYHSVLQELDQYLRYFVKYPADDAPDLLTDTMSQVRDELWRILETHNIDINR